MKERDLVEQREKELVFYDLFKIRFSGLTNTQLTLDKLFKVMPQC